MKKKKITWLVTDNNCWECNSHKPSNNYPQFYKNGKVVRLHRHIYEECFGEIPKGLVVRHKCDNTFCINPEHLELGTHKDNVNDKVKRNRQAKGEKNGSAKLTKEQVLQIRNDNRMGKEIAKDFNVSRATISQIKNKITW
mgnify:CR=1 FL=1